MTYVGIYSATPQILNTNVAQGCFFFYYEVILYKYLDQATNAYYAIEEGVAWETDTLSLG